MLPLLLDLRYPLHRLDRSLDELTVVADRDVPPLLKLDGRVLEGCGHRSMWAEMQILTIVISLPAAFRNAFVQRTFLGLRFILQATLDPLYTLESIANHT